MKKLVFDVAAISAPCLIAAWYQPDAFVAVSFSVLWANICGFIEGRFSR